MLTHRIHLPDGTEIEFFASDHFADDFPNMFDFSAFPAYPTNWKKARKEQENKRKKAVKNARKSAKKARAKNRGRQ